MHNACRLSRTYNLGSSNFARRYSRIQALPISLAATLGIISLFSFRPVTKMFQFTGFPHSKIFYSLSCYRVLALQGFPIRIPADQDLLAVPRGFSQLYTSFVGCQYLGIPHQLFVALPIVLSSFDFNTFSSLMITYILFFDNSFCFSLSNISLITLCNFQCTAPSIPRKQNSLKTTY